MPLNQSEPGRFVLPEALGGDRAAEKATRDKLFARLPTVPHVLFVFLGGTGQKVRRQLRRLARAHGFDVVFVAADSAYEDLRDIDPREIGPAAAPVYLRTATLAEAEANAVTRRYLDRVDSFEAHRPLGQGSRGRPEIAAIDINLSLSRIDRAFRAALQTLRTPANAALDPWQRGNAAPAQVPPTLHAIFVSGASGAVGACGSVLLPHRLRQLAESLGIMNLQITGLLAGHQFFRNRTDFTERVWASTLRQVDQVCRRGMSYTFADKSVVNDRRPAYDRVIVADAVPQEDVASEAEEDAFAMAIAKGLFLCATSNLLADLEERVADRKATVWTTLQAVYPFASLPALAPAMAATTAQVRVATTGAAS